MYTQEKIDYRRRDLRQECFLDFYEYHLALKGHPGCVYFVIPWLIKEFKLTTEQQYWLCYLNGCTQNILTSWAIFSRFPEFETIDAREFEAWHADNWRKLQYDTDRRYQKGHLVTMVKNYQSIVGDEQVDFFERRVCTDADPYVNFNKLWDIVRKQFHMFGRLSTFSYLEYLKIIGLQIDCPTLFLEDMDGSLSHRNGILKVFGHDDLEQHKTINPGVKHNKKTVEYTKKRGEELLARAKERFKGKDFYKDVNYFTLESTLCCYKSWYRVDRRYPNVYIDMMHDRIEKAKEVALIDTSIFTRCRQESLPDWAIEGGITKAKQNHFRNTGEVLFMGNMFPEKYGRVNVN